MKRRPPVTVPEPQPDLQFTGIDRCDVAGCGAPLAPEDRLSGLCARCEATLPPGADDA